MKYTKNNAKKCRCRGMSMDLVQMSDIVEKEFTSNELLEGLKHLSDEDKKWALLLWVYICSGKEGINKIIEFIEKEGKNEP